MSEMTSLCIAFLVACVISGATAGTLDVNEAGIRVHLIGMSGKFIIAPDDGQSINSSPKRVTIEMDAISEVDVNGDAISGGSVPHSFNTFANQDFNIGAVSSELLQGISAERFIFSSSLGSLTAVLTVGVRYYLFSFNSYLSFFTYKYCCHTCIAI